MRIYIATDLEGATGVCSFRQTLDKDSVHYRDAVQLLMQDVAAVAEGLRDAGADDPFALLDESIDRMVLLAYHAMNGTPDGVLHHTQSSHQEAKFWYDGVERGEIYQHAVIAGYHGVPVMLVTGDEATCREARETLDPNLPTVAVKRGLSRESAVLMAPEETARLLKDGARAAVAALPKLKPYKIGLPVKVRTRCLAGEAGSPENPYYYERTTEVDDPLRIIVPRKP